MQQFIQLKDLDFIRKDRKDLVREWFDMAKKRIQGQGSM